MPPTVQKAEIADFRAGMGRAIERARQIVGWNLDELAQRCPIVVEGEPDRDRDPRQVARWCKGDERDRPQFDVLLSIEENDFGDVLLLELLRLKGARITQRIELPERRRA